MKDMLVLKALDEVQARAKVNCLSLGDVYRLQGSAMKIAKDLIKFGFDIEFYNCYGCRNKGWGANSTSISCNFNKDGTFKRVIPRRTNSQNSRTYIQIKGFSELTELERKLIKALYHCNNYGEVNI